MSGSKGSAGGKATAIILRKKALDTYYLNTIISNTTFTSGFT